ncbi:MAG: hypothetical protein PHS41_02205 [Victivallaceae bacterium]|nr:hypothetical protein [Victivallaceae bacterium]
MKKICFSFVLLTLGIFAAGKSIDIGFSDGKNHGWRLTIGPEFPGAIGSFCILPGEGPNGSAAMRLETVHSGKSCYTGLVNKLKTPLPFQCARITFLNVSGYNHINIQFDDETGQTHQQIVRIPSDSKKYQTITVKPGTGDYVGAWGGAADRKWHGKITRIAILGDRKFLPMELYKGYFLIANVELIAP